MTRGRGCRSRMIAVAILVLGMSVRRSPAPIVESQEQPTPAPQQTSKPKPRVRTQSSSPPQKKRQPSAASSLEGPARFAGTWTGEIKQGFVGHVTATFTVSPDASSVQASQNMGGGTHPATMAGDTLSWPTGVLSATASLTLNSGGQTAQFLLKGMMGHTSSTLRRVGAAPSSVSTTPSNTQPPAPVTLSSANTQGYDTVALRPSGSMSGPKPQPPAEARDQGLTGVGVYTLHFDKPTGNLIDVTISQSTGSTVLDQAALSTLRQWHATPGCPREVPFTITYSVTTP